MSAQKPQNGGFPGKNRGFGTSLSALFFSHNFSPFPSLLFF